MKAILIRRETGDTGTFGTLHVEGAAQVWHTCELLWRNNEDWASCILCGRYSVVRWASPRHGDCFKLLDVPGRDDVLIHAGNTTRDLLGCIAPGRGRGMVDGLPAVTSSRAAMDDLRAATPEGFELTIVSLCSEPFEI
jgi:hypothetical protein